MRLFAVLMVTLFGTIASAQTLPERFMVTDVASDDTLNIRAEPDATSDIIGEFGPNTLNVEILRVQEGWGQVPTAEGLGWVSMRFLADNPWPEGEVPRPLACSGTEPFWSLTLHANEQQTNPLTIDTNASYSNLGEDNGVARTQTIIYEDSAHNGFLIRTQEGDPVSAIRTLMVSGRACNDGMNDRPFGMSATLFNRTSDGNSVQTGCCTMQVN